VIPSGSGRRRGGCSQARILVVLAAAAGLILGVPPQRGDAQPGGFPDWGGFAAVAPDGFFVVDAIAPRRLYFSTPYNVQCDFSAAQDSFNLPAQPTQGINCTGDIPPAGAASGGCQSVHASPGANGAGPAYVVGQRADNCGAQFSRGPQLSPGQKVSYQHATCAVGADQLVACLDTTTGEHGFVLQPARSWAF
jgi:hypothetical protein